MTTGLLYGPIIAVAGCVAFYPVFTPSGCRRRYGPEQRVEASDISVYSLTADHETLFRSRFAQTEIVTEYLRAKLTGGFFTADGGKRAG